MYGVEREDPHVVGEMGSPCVRVGCSPYIYWKMAGWPSTESLSCFSCRFCDEAAELGVDSHREAAGRARDCLLHRGAVTRSASSR